MDENVIKEFASNKMDCEAIVAASDNELRDMGLKEKGHIICLKVFCKENCSNDERKRILANIVKGTGSDRHSQKNLGKWVTRLSI